MIEVEVLDEGKTWSNTLSYLGLLPSMKSQPDWSTDVVIAALAPGENHTRREELSAGTYVSICGQSVPYQVWPGGLMTVED